MFLSVSEPIYHPDALILLGGESHQRPLLVVKLYKSRVAPLIIITGTGDYNKNRSILLNHGIPKSAIFIETESFSTYSNATELQQLLIRLKIQRALLVTSSFHTRRALATFQKVIPSIKFGIIGADFDSSILKNSDYHRISHILFLEFIKIIAYTVLYQINPFC